MFPSGPWHLVGIQPDEEKITAKSFDVHDETAARQWIDERQGKENLYYHVNRLRLDCRNKKAKKSDVVAVTYLHVDVDDPTALEALATYEPKPTVTVFSGGGNQLLWRLREPSGDIESAERANRSLEIKLEGDNCHNVDRILRLPGTINVPNKKKRQKGRVPSLAYVVEKHTDWSLSYSLTEFPQAGLAGGELELRLTGGLVPIVTIDQLSNPIDSDTATLIINGDDLSRPIGSNASRYPSRSEVVYRVTCDLVRAKCSDNEIAGILTNRSYQISDSILEKANILTYVGRQIVSAKEAVSTEWPDLDRHLRPRPTYRNTLLATRRLGVFCERDEFHKRKRVQGQALQQFVGELTDDLCAILRNLILKKFGFDPGKENTLEATNVLCLENSYHPIREYLDRLKWDGVPRISSWLHHYLSAEDTPLNREIGRIMLIAGVRRIRQPGVKFDIIIVWEGPQGRGKSTALKILAGGDENFSDQNILTLDAKTQVEVMDGVWIYELGELEGLSRAETNKVKAFASRSVDRARPAYGRFREDSPRQCIFVGTTNEGKYLRDMSGNRRFWPIKTDIIKLGELARDRDQLWAEAAYWEAKDVEIVLAEEFWPVAAREQEARLEDEPWEDILENVVGTLVGNHLRIKTEDLFGEHYLNIPPERREQYQMKKIAHIMHKHGWEGPDLFAFPSGKRKRGYQRAAEGGDDGR
jgi:hypothetical protein